MRERIFVAGGWLLFFGVLITAGSVAYQYTTDWAHASLYLTLGSFTTAIGGGLAIYGILSKKKVEGVRALSRGEILKMIVKGYRLVTADLEELERTIRATKHFQVKRKLMYIRDVEKRHQELFQEIREVHVARRVEKI